MNQFRIGHGYDVHQLVQGRKLILGGIHIPYEKGALGHSDADVVAHAICDALLGAAALGDIGQHFPDTEEQYRNSSSLVLLKNVLTMIKAEGFAIGNIDCTIILEKPKVSPYSEQIRKSLANCLELDISSLSVKATTAEKLGVIGKGKAIAAEAVATIYS